MCEYVSRTRRYKAQFKRAKEDYYTACDLEAGLVGYRALPALSIEPAVGGHVFANSQSERVWLPAVFVHPRKKANEKNLNLQRQ